MKDRLNMIGELFLFIRAGRRWWLLPVLIGLLVVGAFAVAATASPLSPFIYPLF